MAENTGPLYNPEWHPSLDIAMAWWGLTDVSGRLYSGTPMADLLAAFGKHKVRSCARGEWKKVVADVSALAALFHSQTAIPLEQATIMDVVRWSYRQCQIAEALKGR